MTMPQECKVENVWNIFKLSFFIIMNFKIDCFQAHYLNLKPVSFCLSI